MFIDKNLVLSDAQVITNASAATTDYVDTLAAGDAIYPGAVMEFLVDTTATTADSGTVTFSIQTDDNSSFSSATTLAATGAIAAATLTAGYKPLVVVVPQGCERYIRGYYTLANNLTAGKFDCRIVSHSDKQLDRGL